MLRRGPPEGIFGDPFGTCFALGAALQRVFFGRPFGTCFALGAAIQRVLSDNPGTSGKKFSSVGRCRGLQANKGNERIKKKEKTEIQELQKGNKTTPMQVLEMQPSRVYFLDTAGTLCFGSAALQGVFFGHPFGARLWKSKLLNYISKVKMNSVVN